MSNPVNDDDADAVEGLTPAERELEAALSRLTPAPATCVNDAVAGNHDGLAYRDKLMFRAGKAAGEQKERAAGRRQLWAWRGAAAALAAVSIAVSARSVAQPRQPVQVVYANPPVRPAVQGPASRETTSSAADRAYGQSDSGQGYAVTAAPALGLPAVSLRAVSSSNPSNPPEAPAAGWLGVRGDYLSTRAAVLRWGVSALPRVDESPGEGSTPTPLDAVKKLFWHTSDGGRL